MSVSRRAARSETTLRERAYGAFTEHLLKQAIRPGQFISQRELVALTGFPLGAIRELIPRLEAEGLIVTVPQRGMQVLPVDLSLIRNAFQFRLILEREAVAAFTRSAEEDAIGRMEAAHRAVRARAERGVGPKLVEEAQQVDRQFHEAVIDGLGNDIVSQAYRVNWIKVRLIRQAETSLHDELVMPVMDEHLAVIRAMAARDVAAAVEAATNHIAGARNRALRL
jgi:DNA-binding GntR family transcriptional regulator